MLVRWYLGKIPIGVLDRVGNKSYVMFLAECEIGNKKIGYRKVQSDLTDEIEKVIIEKVIEVLNARD